MGYIYIRGAWNKNYHKIIYIAYKTHNTIEHITVKTINNNR
jgi:hypothetical protein